MINAVAGPSFKLCIDTLDNTAQCHSRNTRPIVYKITAWTSIRAHSAPLRAPLTGCHHWQFSNSDRAANIFSKSLAFFWLVGAFTFKTLFRHFAKQAPRYNKKTWNWDADSKIIRDGRGQPLTVKCCQVASVYMCTMKGPRVLGAGWRSWRNYLAILKCPAGDVWMLIVSGETNWNITIIISYSTGEEAGQLWCRHLHVILGPYISHFSTIHNTFTD